MSCRTSRIRQARPVFNRRPVRLRLVSTCSVARRACGLFPYGQIDHVVPLLDVGKLCGWGAGRVFAREN